ncbi:DMT family transporter [Paenibacillus sp. P96]|uniref:DMT family transporter n=1 Tax=Paenibacillus zeirhizosphaerae TaxID=2987519 RepID=A0ABT9FR47_9BACL|nr:DMT family transporter [Paenibacillus sp. P96]MDP4097207.1 DMT family transporter [Paenibacillus sp. P96]
MKGILFAAAAGAFITLQGVANARIGQDIGTWQAAAVTQWTGFITALLLLLILRDRTWRNFRQVKPLYLTGGAFAAIIIYSNVSAIQEIGVTFTIAALLITQLCTTFVIDSNGWFGGKKLKMSSTQLIGIGVMIAGVMILKM